VVRTPLCLRGAHGGVVLGGVDPLVLSQLVVEVPRCSPIQRIILLLASSLVIRSEAIPCCPNGTNKIVIEVLGLSGGAQKTFRAFKESFHGHQNVTRKPSAVVQLVAFYDKCCLLISPLGFIRDKLMI
jgi:hypothetical protein